MSNRLLATSAIPNSKFTHAPNISCYTAQSLLSDVRDICDRYVREFKKFEESKMCDDIISKTTRAHSNTKSNTSYSFIDGFFDELKNSAESETYENTIERLELIERELERAKSIIWLVTNTGEKRFLSIIDECHDLIHTALQSSENSLVVAQIYRQMSTSSLTRAEQRVLQQKRHRRLKRGRHLNESSLKKLNDVRASIGPAQNAIVDYYESVEAETLLIDAGSDTRGIPIYLLEEGAKRARRTRYPEATLEEGPWLLETDATTRSIVVRHALSPTLRKRFYCALTSSSEDASNIKATFREFLRLWRRHAHLLGFNNCAEMQNIEMNASSVSEVLKLLRRVNSKANAYRGREEKSIRQLKLFGVKGIARFGKIKPWDRAFLKERLFEKQFGFSQIELSNYLTLEGAIEGIRDTAARLFGINIIAADHQVPRWRDDLRFFHVVDDKGQTLGGIYLDPYKRKDKGSGAWMYPLTHRVFSEERVEEPIAYLSCSQAPPSKFGVPARMEFEDVRALFHEFGHGLQHVMAKSATQGASGIGLIEEDTIEIASQFLEAWCFDAETIKVFAKHRESKVSLNDEFSQRIVATRSNYIKSALPHDAAASWADLELHGEGYKKFSSYWESPHTLNLEIDGIETRTSPQSLMRPGQRYRYLWSQLFVEDALALFQGSKGNPSKVRALGRRFADTLMKQGGSNDPSEIFRDFRGRKVSQVPLFAHFDTSNPKPSRGIWRGLGTKLQKTFRKRPAKKSVAT